MTDFDIENLSQRQLASVHNFLIHLSSAVERTAKGKAGERSMWAGNTDFIGDAWQKVGHFISQIVSYPIEKAQQVVEEAHSNFVTGNINEENRKSFQAVMPLLNHVWENYDRQSVVWYRAIDPKKTIVYGVSESLFRAAFDVFTPPVSATQQARNLLRLPVDTEENVLHYRS